MKIANSKKVNLILYSISQKKIIHSLVFKVYHYNLKYRVHFIIIHDRIMKAKSTSNKNIFIKAM
jgi:hypothetical protein